MDDVGTDDRKKEIDPERRGFGQRLQAARKHAKRQDGGTGYTQDEIAARFGVKKATVSAWETGRGAPDAYILRALAKLYGVSSDALLWEDSLSPEAMAIAAEFDHLGERQRGAWRLAWLGFVAGTAAGGENLPAAPKDLPEPESQPNADESLNPKRRPSTVESTKPPARQSASRKS